MDLIVDLIVENWPYFRFFLRPRLSCSFEPETPASLLLSSGYTLELVAVQTTVCGTSTGYFFIRGGRNENMTNFQQIYN